MLATEVNVPEVLERIEAGESYAEIAKSLGCGRATLYRAIEAYEQSDPKLADSSARAKAASAEAWLDKGMEAVEKAMDKGGAVDATAARAYAQECARRAAIRNPQYREKQSHEHSGPDGKPIQFQRLEVVIVDPKE